MNIFEAIALGALQGLTEFLPVSSSGHLVLLQKIFGIEEPALFFDTMLHVGTLFAVFAVLWADIWAILKKIIQPMTAFIILGTIPTVIVALVFKDSIEAAFSTGGALGFAFLITTAALCLSEVLATNLTNNTNSIKKGSSASINWINSLIIGLCQAIAIIPGVSRSGMTLSGALACGVDRNKAAHFSFLLSIPAILGALVLQVKDLIDEGGTAFAASESSIGIAAIVAGTVTAAIVGFFSVRFMLKIVRQHRLWGFGIYTGVLGVLVLVDRYATHFFF
ncbi:MAG: undecaprenyl-diphosphate phosphatase [Spirochaetaceae bacterium]|jgi:undecaprenyl-diphosphatase|nr:undecaprenyl-diphosphate phosphatase [Spirochaetaceae bacterium]